MTDFHFPIKEKKEVAEDTLMVVLDTSGHEYVYKAGQHAEFTIENPPETDDEGNSRLFSFVTAPYEKDVIAFTTRLRDTAFKRVLKKLEPGTKLRVSEPSGQMTLHKDESIPAVCIAGGIGITPMRSIIRQALQDGVGHQLYLFYSNRTKALEAFGDEFRAQSQDHENFSFIPTLTDADDVPDGYEKGRVDENMLTKHITDVGKPVYYVSGPPKMVSGITSMLQDAGVDELRIRSEEFDGY